MVRDLGPPSCVPAARERGEKTGDDAFSSINESTEEKAGSLRKASDSCLRSWMRGKTIERASTPIAKTNRMPNGQRYIRTVPAVDAFLGGVGLAVMGADDGLAGGFCATAVALAAEETAVAVDIAVFIAEVAVRVTATVAAGDGVPKGLLNATCV